MRIAAIVVLLALTGCKVNRDPTTVDYWADQAKNRATRVDALKELGKLGKKEATPVLLKWLGEPGPWQGDAAYSLALLGDPNVAPMLISHIDYNAGATGGGSNTDAVYFNLDLVRSLALLRAPSATQPMLKLLQNPEPKTREVVVNALGQLQAAAAVQPLLALLNDANTSPVLAPAAVRALGNIGAPEAIGALTLALYNDTLYEEARYALLQQGGAAVPVLILTLNRGNPTIETKRTADGKPLPDGTIEARAASVLGAMHATGGPAEAAVIGAFEKLYKRYQANTKAPPATLFSATIELAYALGNLGSPAAIKALIPLTKASNDTLRVAAAEALTAAGPDAAAMQALLAAASSGTADVREAMISAITRTGDAEVLPALDALAKKGDKQIPSSVLNEIIEGARDRLVVAGECKKDAPCWRKKLHSENPAVRERAAYELGWLGVKDARGELLKSAEDDVPEVRMAAVLALQRLGGTDPAVLQKIYDTWQSKMEYAAVNQELKCLIARSKSHR